MAALTNMDLDNENFIDTIAFDQSKAILDNAMDELSHYLTLFNKGDFKSFPRVKVDWDRNYYSLCSNIEKTSLFYRINSKIVILSFRNK